jgi:hypothetical protein
VWDPPIDAVLENGHIVRVHAIEGPLHEPLKEPKPTVLPGAMHDIPLDQAAARCLCEHVDPQLDRARRWLPFKQINF